jgi:hypothetical protein
MSQEKASLRVSRLLHFRHSASAVNELAALGVCQLVRRDKRQQRDCLACPSWHLQAAVPLGIMLRGGAVSLR